MYLCIGLEFWKAVTCPRSCLMCAIPKQTNKEKNICIQLNCSTFYMLNVNVSSTNRMWKVSSRIHLEILQPKLSWSLNNIVLEVGVVKLYWCRTWHTYISMQHLLVPESWNLLEFLCIEGAPDRLHFFSVPLCCNFTCCVCVN